MLKFQDTDRCLVTVYGVQLVIGFLIMKGRC